MHIVCGAGPQARSAVMTYMIHGYPAELIDIVEGAAGERILVRPVLPQDAEPMQAFVRGLSPQSRRNRFFRMLRELPPVLLGEFTSVDYHSHLALLASVLVEGRRRAPPVRRGASRQQADAAPRPEPRLRRPSGSERRRPVAAREAPR